MRNALLRVESLSILTIEMLAKNRTVIAVF